MAIMTFDLIHGFKVGESIHTEVGLRKLATGDYIDAQLAAEKAVVQNGKALAYTSDVLLGLELLCRQVEYIGSVQGPFTIKDFRKLEPEDFQLIQEESENLDNQLAEALAQRGRSGGDG
ncbi:phage tail assembly protein [Marinomonas sp. RS-M-Aa-14]|uniref:phage tail assembly protein n=1 Tax=Marinomonas sp. RS-M-Aa-14 TaxID=3241169 RepID=UPI00390CA1B7